MKRFSALILALICLLGILGCGQEDGIGDGVSETFPNLNIATLKSLVDMHGEDLSWKDLAPYWYTDIGSGIYVLRYPVAPDYYLLVSGTNMEGTPAEILLAAVHAPENYIDVRTESIDDFVASGIAQRATATAKEKALNIAMEHCQVDYDYTEITCSIDFGVQWQVAFWKNRAKSAAQTIILDEKGDVIQTWCAK